MEGSSGSPTPYQLPTKDEADTDNPPRAGAALASGSIVRNANAAKHAIRLGAIRTIRKIEFHHAMADEDITLRIHADAPFGIAEHEDFVIGFGRGRSAVD